MSRVYSVLSESGSRQRQEKYISSDEETKLSSFLPCQTFICFFPFPPFRMGWRCHQYRCCCGNHVELLDDVSTEPSHHRAFCSEEEEEF